MRWPHRDDKNQKSAPLMKAAFTAKFDEISSLLDHKKIILLDGCEKGHWHLHNLILHHLTQKPNFYDISGSYGPRQFKIDLRKATSLHVEIDRMVYEGEVTTLQREKDERDTASTVKKSISITLSTTDQRKKLWLGQPYIDALREQNVSVGDVIVVDVESGAITNVGNIHNTSSRNNIPRGNVHKKKRIVQDVSLHDLDDAIAKGRKGQGIYSFLSQQSLTGGIDKVVESLMGKGWAKLNDGLVHINEAHMLNTEFFAFIATALESSLCPSVYLSTAYRICTIRGTEIIPPDCIPVVLLRQMVIVRPHGDVFPLATIYWSNIETQELLTRVIDKVRQKKRAECVIGLAGPFDTGKTVLGFQISQQLGSEVLFSQMFDSSGYSLDTLKVLKEYLHRAVGIRVKKIKEVYEGEVVELSSKETWRTCGITIGLKTVSSVKQLKLKRPLSDTIMKEKVAVGDVVSIDVHSGAVVKIEDLPKGEVHKKELVQEMTLYDFDEAIAGRGRQGHSICAPLIKKLSSESNLEKAIIKFKDEGILEINPGILYIDEVPSLSMDCFKHISEVAKSPLFPVLIFATDKDISCSLDDIQLQLLNPMVIIHTESCEPANL